MTTKTTRTRRRRRSLGLPKKRATRKQKQPDLGALVDKEFTVSETVKSVIVLDAEGNEHEFSVGDDVLVVPSEKDPDTAHLQPDTENWVAKIRKIVRRDNGEAWVEVGWYWSPQHVASIVESFDPSSYATYELFPDGDFQNYIPVNSIVDTVKVFQYDDCSLEPPFIGPTTFFFRHTFSPKINRVTAFSSEEVCSICEQPYNPDAIQRFPESFTMHFCPRDTCQTAWHRQCLSTNRIRKRPACADRKLSLLCSIPTKSLERSASPDPSNPPPSLLSLLLFGELPSDLLELASQPIVKPTFQLSYVHEEPLEQHEGRRGVPKEPENRIHNVAGNITTVLKARLLVNDVLRGTTLPQDWRKEVGWDHGTISSIIVDDENDPCPPLLCPTCGEHI